MKNCSYVVIFLLYFLGVTVAIADSDLIEKAIEVSKKNVDKWILVENEWTSAHEDEKERIACFMDALDARYSVKISRNRSVNTLVFQSNGIAQDACSCELKVRLSTKDGSFHSAEGKVLVCAVWPS